MRHVPVLQWLVVKVLTLFSWLNRVQRKPMRIPAALLRPPVGDGRRTWRGRRHGGRSKTRFMRADRKRRNAREQRKRKVEQRRQAMRKKALFALFGEALKPPWGEPSSASWGASRLT